MRPLAKFWCCIQGSLFRFPQRLRGRDFSTFKEESLSTYMYPYDVKIRSNCTTLASHTLDTGHSFDFNNTSIILSRPSPYLLWHQSDSSLPYNLSISPSELHTTIHKNPKNASTGPDNIYASMCMLKNQHPNSLTYFLSLFNSILHQGIYSLFWKLANILTY